MPGEAAPEAETETPSIIGGASSEPEADTPSIVGGAEADPAEPEGEEKPEGEGDPAEPEGGQPEGEGEGEEEPEGAPDEYAEFELPEGITLDEAANADFVALAKEFNLSQGNAQKLVGIATGLMEKQAEAFLQAHADRVAEWRDETLSDAEVGGAGHKETLRYVALARDEFATPELLKFLEDTGTSNHPEVVRLLARVGKAIGEDTFVQAGRATPQSKPFFDHPTSRAAARA